jgi:hypothetical protein
MAGSGPSGPDGIVPFGQDARTQSTTIVFGNGSEADGGPGQPPIARFKIRYHG